MDRYLKKFKDDSGRQGQEVKRSECPDETVQPSVSGQQSGKRKKSDLSQIEHDNISSDEDPIFPVIEKKNYKQKFRDSWLEEKSFRTWLVRNPSKLEEPFCQLCAKSIQGGIVHIRRHAESVMHKKRVKNASETPRITMFYNKNKEEKLHKLTKSAEMKLVAFVAEHNLSFSVLDHLPQLIASVCPDSEVAKKIKCCRKKGTKITKDLMRSENIFNLSKKLKTCKFSLIIDESTDISSVKNLAMVVRFYDKELKRVHDAFLALLEVEDATAEAIFVAISHFFEENNIPKNNLFGFGADNASTMMGRTSGVRERLLAFNPDLFVIGCTCHSLALVSNAACSYIPNSIEQFTKDVYNYFTHSSKRILSFKQYQLFAEVKPHKLLRLSQTRWLSLETVVKRILEQWPALQIFFSNEALVEKVEKAKPIWEALNNDIFKLYLSFLGYILSVINKINLEFQSESFRAHILLPRITSIYKTVLNNFMKASYVKNCSLDNVAFLPENYLELNDIYFGADCEVLILKNSVPEDDLKSFRVRCLSFYIELCKELKSRFKFNDPILNFVENLDPKIVTKNPESIIPFYLKFPYLFSNNVNLEELSTEWRNIAYNEALTIHVDKPIEEFWNIVFDTQNCSGDYMYPNLTEFVQGIFALPHSSASAERIFSQINLIKTKNRNRLNTRTCDALMHTKSLVGSSNCFNFVPSDHLLARNLKTQTLSDDENEVTY